MGVRGSSGGGAVNWLKRTSPPNRVTCRPAPMLAADPDQPSEHCRLTACRRAAPATPHTTNSSMRSV